MVVAVTVFGMAADESFFFFAEVCSVVLVVSTVVVPFLAGPIVVSLLVDSLDATVVNVCSTSE